MTHGFNIASRFKPDVDCGRGREITKMPRVHARNFAYGVIVTTCVRVLYCNPPDVWTIA